MKGKMIKSFIAGLALVLGISAASPICASAAWKQDSNGWWNTEGNSYSIGWKQIDGAWYYFTSNGYMQTGWVNDNGSWYYLNNSGAMKTGWINDNGTWYYTNESGVMHTGFLTLDNKTYYLNESGSMVTGDITLSGIKYSFDGNGEKIGLTTVETTESTNATTENEIVKAETTSGGGGGGSVSGSNDSTFASYSDLYGKWTVKSYIKNSGMDTSLSSDQIDLIVGEKFTVTKDKIYHTLYSVSNPTIDENILDNSEFKNKFGIDISNLGIKGDKVNCITISAEGKTGYVIVASNKSVYAIGKGAAFKLAKA
ncbi:N-acetylmuramoyl-L-alanine amidase family protein [Clostridium butyricum]|uniref:Surface protein PspC n=1 Tax=Clostridium butyricum E4 str. BoNT E BL5262 TaxID=632245 RepID=C4IDB5_CLOBU|nr:N-acetylmuramoyl-L-alanine amidase family protein [Clostridium butyricum]EDT76662.1 surface protein PspC [Clostridium butyricum 5521]EEP55845.1 surface protein PspC [Clostridium butyricum E4 str. BoNT E BL5262]NFL31842.1 N-acetylmuramoyl-L-alanine amidase family protein [Clostridium butyricum]NFS19775.1 N-acetylmuramoyl-L-alanine amidase family protein [Clostridium butyricum]